MPPLRGDCRLGADNICKHVLTDCKYRGVSAHRETVTPYSSNSCQQGAVHVVMYWKLNG